MDRIFNSYSANFKIYLLLRTIFRRKYINENRSFSISWAQLKWRKNCLIYLSLSILLKLSLYFCFYIKAYILQWTSHHSLINSVLSPHKTFWMNFSVTQKPVLPAFSKKKLSSVNINQQHPKSHNSTTAFNKYELRQVLRIDWVYNCCWTSLR